MSEGFMGSGNLLVCQFICSWIAPARWLEPITAANEGLGMIYRELIKDPQVVETVYISVIRFLDRADQDDLVAIDQFTPPQLTANGTTAMGAALHVLVDSIEQDLTLNTATKHGDYRPLVFLLTDGPPTDEYRSEIAKIQALRGSRRPTIVALGCGGQVDTAMLRELTENVYLMPTLNAETLRGFFKWISGSIWVSRAP